MLRPPQPLQLQLKPVPSLQVAAEPCAHVPAAPQHSSRSATPRPPVPVSGQSETDGFAQICHSDRASTASTAYCRGGTSGTSSSSETTSQAVPSAASRGTSTSASTPLGETRWPRSWHPTSVAPLPPSASAEAAGACGTRLRIAGSSCGGETAMFERGCGATRLAAEFELSPAMTQREIAKPRRRPVAVVVEKVAELPACTPSASSSAPVPVMRFKPVPRQAAGTPPIARSVSQSALPAAARHQVFLSEPVAITAASGYSSPRAVAVLPPPSLHAGVAGASLGVRQRSSPQLRIPPCLLPDQPVQPNPADGFASPIGVPMLQTMQVCMTAAPYQTSRIRSSSPSMRTYGPLSVASLQQASPTTAATCSPAQSVFLAEQGSFVLDHSSSLQFQGGAGDGCSPLAMSFSRPPAKVGRASSPSPTTALAATSTAGSCRSSSCSQVVSPMTQSFYDPSLPAHQEVSAVVDLEFQFSCELEEQTLTSLSQALQRDYCRCMAEALCCDSVQVLRAQETWRSVVMDMVAVGFAHETQAMQASGKLCHGNALAGYHHGQYSLLQPPQPCTRLHRASSWLREQQRKVAEAGSDSAPEVAGTAEPAQLEEHLAVAFRLRLHLHHPNEASFGEAAREQLRSQLAEGLGCDHLELLNWQAGGVQVETLAQGFRSGEKLEEARGRISFSAESGGSCALLDVARWGAQRVSRRPCEGDDAEAEVESPVHLVEMGKQVLFPPPSLSSAEAATALSPLATSRTTSCSSWMRSPTPPMSAYLHTPLTDGPEDAVSGSQGDSTPWQAAEPVQRVSTPELEERYFNVVERMGKQMDILEAIMARASVVPGSSGGADKSL
eukprot:TRINITY_DN11660_c0_g1_i1.p1 TRINITY_DN11660_c0_g1~~TRINITY_DN11660_c0_g1_i1.p1  ORF type:complete len:840 (-),score=152.70 TRINITY_DN11660_c0_g1_i1:234-2753(-)